MKITRNVILDLLPLYLADEVSADTKALVENYLESDPELANTAKKLAPIEKPNNIPVPLSREAELMAYKKAKRTQLIFVLALAAVLSLFLVITIVVFFFSSS
jgi:hypothetical protein